MPLPARKPGNKVRQADLHSYEGVSTVADTDTEIAHRLGTVPTTLILTPRTTGAVGYAMETAKSATSVTIRASVSGVEVGWKVLA